MTDVQMVSNSEVNHLKQLQKLFQSNTDRLVIASPYLATDIPNLLSEFSFSRVKVVELITTFKPFDLEQLTKPAALKSFFDFFIENYPDILVRLHIDNLLHGKLYISIQDSGCSLILSSANFTRKGLCKNHEWGVFIKNDDVIINNIVEDLFGSIEYHDVTYIQIKKACQFADRYEIDHPEKIEMPGIPRDFLKTVYSVENSDNTDPKYFLKPVGVSEAPILLKDQRDFSDLHQNLHFSKRKPKGVQKGDILITVAVSAGSLLSYFKVTGGLQEVTEDEILREDWKERWPWYMEGRNQSPEFGGQWWLYNIQRTDVLNEFLQKYPGMAVTYAGGTSLGTLNFGSDKVRITKEFGDFLIEKIENSNLS